MTARPAYFESLVEQTGAAWNGYWFTTADQRPLAALRIAFGIVILLFLLDWSPDLKTWFGSQSVMPPKNTLALLDGNPDIQHPSLLWGADDSSLTLIHSVSLAVAAMFTLGIFTRVTTWLTLFAVLSYIHRAPFAAGMAETVATPVLFYLGFAAAGSYWSVDALRSKEEPAPSETTNIVLNLIRIHFAALVFMSGAAKFAGPGWWDGEAIWSLAAQTQSRPIDLTWIRNYEILVNLWTYSVLAFELAFPVLISNRLLRPIVLTLAAVIWGSLALVTGDVIYSLALIAGCIAFAPPEWFVSTANAPQKPKQAAFAGG